MDLAKIRQDTPNCEDKIFFNSAGSSLMPNSVSQKIREYLNKEDELGGYKTAEIYQSEINQLYREAAQLINTRSKNISFAFNATDAYARILSAIDFKEGDVIITTDDDYVSNYINFIALKQRFGIEVRRIQNLDNGDLDINSFERLISEKRPRLVAVTHIPTNTGLIQDVESIGQICEENELTYLVDACQSVGQINVDVKRIKCDFLSVTGRKFLRGPRGTGFLYVSDRMLETDASPLFVDLRGAEWTSLETYSLIDTARRFESWEVPYAFLVGLKEAIRYTNELGIEQIETYNQGVMQELRDGLKKISDVTLYDRGSRQGNILSMRKEGKSLEEIKSVLDTQKVFYSITEKSNAMIDFEKKGIDWILRISPHYFNTREEIIKFMEIIESI